MQKFFLKFLKFKRFIYNLKNFQRLNYEKNEIHKQNKITYCDIALFYILPSFNTNFFTYNLT